jgi:hypothetical protein
MGRTRSGRYADLPPNLYVNPAGYYYYINPYTRKQMGLRRDKAKAIAIALELNTDLEPIKEKRASGRTKSFRTGRRFDERGLIELEYLRENASVFETICGIYFLLQDGEVTYIGQSINCHYRISTHVSERKKDFNSCYIIRAEPEELGDLEALYIKKFNPRHNVAIPRCETEDAWAIEQRLQSSA